jgi:hypothetical protein
MTLKENLQQQITAQRKSINTYRKDPNIPPESIDQEEKGLKKLEDEYKYHFEGGERPSHLPASSNNIWVGCHKCEWEQQLDNNRPQLNQTEEELFKETGACFNYCGSQTDNLYFYPSNNRKRRSGKSWLDLNKERAEYEKEQGEGKRDNPITKGQRINAIEKEENKEQEKQALEERINRLQQQLNMFKRTLGFSDYDIQKIERQIAETKQEYKSKYGELPSSLREDVGGGRWKSPFKWKELCSLNNISNSSIVYSWIDCLFSV